MKHNISFNRNKKTTLKKIAKFSTVALFAAHMSVIHAAVPIGKGMYYDQTQVQKLAAKFPSRVSKDAGYPLFDNYSSIKSSFGGSHFDLQKPITAGRWWTPLLAIDKPAANVTAQDYLQPLMMIANPFTIQLTQDGTKLGIPLQNSAKVDNAHVDRGYDNTLDLTITTGDLTGTAPLVADYSDWAVTAQWKKNNQPLLKTTLVEGSPFIFFEKKNNQPAIFTTFNNSQSAVLLSAKNSVSIFKTKNASDNSIFHYYAFYTRPSTAAFSWQDSNGNVIKPADQGGSGNVVPSTKISLQDANPYFTVALIPATDDSSAIALATKMKPYAFNFVTNTQVVYKYNSQNSTVSTNFNMTTQKMYADDSLKNEAVTMIFPWQIDNMSAAQKANCFLADNCASNAGTIQTLKGTMHLIAAPVTDAQKRIATFSISAPYNGVLPTMPNTLTQAQLQKIQSYSMTLPPDPHLDSTNPWTDTYATGKIFSTQAQLIKVANMLMGDPSNPNTFYKNVRDTTLAKLKQQVNSFLTGLAYTTCPTIGTCQPPEGAWFFAYNDKWDTFVPYPSGFFTATTLTDHFFHYGYFLDAAATIAQFDKTWAKEYGGMINLMIRDLWDYTYDTQSAKRKMAPAVTFAHFKEFDPYTALSSALGMPYSMDNVNEEDSAEFMNFAQGLILWGENTNGITFTDDSTTPKQLRDLGMYLYTTEQQGLSYYHFNQHPNAGVFPINWANASTGQTYLVVGNVWQGKMDRSTYFCGGQPCYYQNLASNSLPITTGSFYMGYDPNFVLQVYQKDAKNPCSGDRSNSAYCGTLLKYLALGDADTAFQYFSQYFDAQNNQPDPGETKANIFYWIANLQNLGTLNDDMVADTPTYAVFNKPNKPNFVVAYNGSSQKRDVNFYKNGSLQCTIKDLQPNQQVGQQCNQSTGQYNYTVALGYPFKAVLINNSIKCPDPSTPNKYTCLSNKQAPGDTLLITGSNGHLCNLGIQPDGNLKINASNYCYINYSPATPTNPGYVALPSGF